MVVLCGDYTLAVVSLWFSQVCTNGLVKSLGVRSDIRFIGMKLSSVLGYFVLAFSKRIAIILSFRGKW